MVATAVVVRVLARKVARRELAEAVAAAVTLPLAAPFAAMVVGTGPGRQALALVVTPTQPAVEPLVATAATEEMVVAGATNSAWMVIPAIRDRPAKLAASPSSPTRAADPVLRRPVAVKASKWVRAALAAAAALVAVPAVAAPALTRVTTVTVEAVAAMDRSLSNGVEWDGFAGSEKTDYRLIATDDGLSYTMMFQSPTTGGPVKVDVPPGEYRVDYRGQRNNASQRVKINGTISIPPGLDTVDLIRL